MNQPCRSVLFVPASSKRALARARTLQVDAVILDLEDAVAPDQKQAARAAALMALRRKDWQTPRLLVRINSLEGSEGVADVLALAPEAPHGLVVPKVESVETLLRVRARMARALSRPGAPAGGPEIKLWAMIETPRGLLQLEAIAASAAQTGLNALVTGTNDLARTLHCDGLAAERQALLAHLSRIVLVARSHGLLAFDGVYNAFADATGFAREAAQGRRLGFDGKSLIHPDQIAPAEAAFGPDAAQIHRAKAIVRAFRLKKNVGKGAVNLNGKMVERLHLQEAQALLDSLPAPAAQGGARANAKAARTKKAPS